MAAALGFREAFGVRRQSEAETALSNAFAPAKAVFSVKVPPYRPWNTACYLSKAERELGFIFRVRGAGDEPDRRLQIKWWLNNGAVGGGNSITMPISGYLQCLDWYSHPWALVHEMMHNLGYGHTHEMNRLDEAVQEQMEFFRWGAAGAPAYQPTLPELAGNPI